METVITFTPSELVGFLGTIAGVVSAIGLLVIMQSRNDQGVTYGSN